MSAMNQHAVHPKIKSGGAQCLFGGLQMFPAVDACCWMWPRTIFDNSFVHDSLFRDDQVILLLSLISDIAAAKVASVSV